MLTSIVLGVLGATCAVLIPIAPNILVTGPVTGLPVALAAILGAAALELSWFRVGSVPRSTPVISLPVLARPTLIPFLTAQAAIGVIMPCVLLVLLVDAG
ncbi:MAG: hypothetical protein LH624_04130 [Cryobacterium sp.]|nr:hypothetical protein [Cryobacterium sp.]